MVATETEEAGFSDQIPENNIVVFTPGGQQRSSLVVAEGGDSTLVAVERADAYAFGAVPDPNASVGMPCSCLLISSKQMSTSNAKLKKNKKKKLSIAGCWLYLPTGMMGWEKRRWR